MKIKINIKIFKDKNESDYENKINTNIRVVMNTYKTKIKYLTFSTDRTCMISRQVAL